jgi:hypothetical protein
MLLFPAESFELIGWLATTTASFIPSSRAVFLLPLSLSLSLRAESHRTKVPTVLFLSLSLPSLSLIVAFRWVLWEIEQGFVCLIFIE